MKYKLLKDTPTIKAGAIFQEIVREVDGSKILKEYDSNNKNTMLVSEIKNFDEWFEETEEPTDSAHWKPKIAEKYFYINEYGDVEWEVWNDDGVDNRLMAMGLVYRTAEECEKAKERRLAKVRLEQTSTFKPDFENGKGGWIVYYDHGCETLAVCDFDYYDAGEPVRYATKEEAEKSIRENREDWMIYFGVKE